MKGFAIRAVSGLVYAGIIVAGLLLGPAAFMLLISLFAAVAVTEFYGLANAHRGLGISLAADIIGALVGIGALAGCASGVVSGKAAAASYIGWLMLRLVMQLYTREISPLKNLAYSLMSQLYIALPLGLMSFVYFAPTLAPAEGAQGVPYGGALLLAMFVMIWLNDTGAFIVGCSIGRHKMFPRISPKKSWEGFGGGIVFAVCSAFAFKYLLPELYPEITLGQMLAMGGVVGIFATLGDLVESLIKRTLGVKDSGSLIPGHGGILDRIDSLLLVSPACIVYLIIISIL